MAEARRDAEAIFLASLEKTNPQERAAYVDESCSGNPGLLRRVRELLGCHEGSQGPFDAPPPGLKGTVESLPLSESPGTVIGPYKLLQQIGEGGMGTVFMAEQTRPVQRKVALKVIKPGMDSRQVIARFEAERQALALMDHPNIAKVLDAGTTEGGLPYFVMELVKGVPITRYCDEHHLTPKERLELFVPICQAIQHAHQKGIIHRDIKPSNVMVCIYDGKPVPKVIDFGVAKAAGPKLTDRTLFTEFGAIVGTFEYMSPEQAQLDQLDIDTRSDIYSLGVLLFELLTGTTPLERKRMKEVALLELLRLVREEESPRPSTRLSTADGLPSIAANRGTEPKKLSGMMRGELDWIVMKTLEKDRNRRYETPNGLAADVQRYLADEPVQACPPSTSYRFRKFARRNKRALVSAALLGVMLLVAVGAVAGSLGWMSRDRAARRLVVEQAVGRALEEGDDLQKQGKWQEALIAVERAGAALASGEVGVEVQQQVSDQLADLHVILRLDELRARWGDHFYHPVQDRAYARLFADFGIDVESLSPAEVAARIRRRASSAVRVAAGLDDWARVLRDWGVALPDQKRDPATWKRLLEAARLADPDPWRRQLRQSMGQENLTALRKLAESSDIAALPVQSLQLMGCALIFGGDVPGCVAWLRKAHRQHPGDTLISFDLSFHLSNLPSADRVDVLRFAEAALATRPQSSNLSTWVGHCLHRLDRYDEAAAQFTKGIELKPEGWEAWSGKAFVHLSRQEWDSAVADFSKAIVLAPKVHTNWWHRGHAYLRLAQWDNAVADFGKVLDQWPDGAEGWYWRGLAFAQLNQPDKALADLRQAIAKGFNNLEQMKNDPKLDPLRSRQDFEMLLEGLKLKVAKEGGKLIHDALVVMERKLANSPSESAEDRYGLAASYETFAKQLKDAGEFEEGEAIYRKGIGILEKLVSDSSSNPTYREQLGHKYRLLCVFISGQAGREQEKERLCREALKTFEKLAADYPDISLHRHLAADTQRWLGGALEEEKRSGEAEQCFRKAVEGFSTLPAEFLVEAGHSSELNEGFRTLAGFLKTKGRNAEAEKVHQQRIELYRKLTATRPNDAVFKQEWARSFGELARFLLAADGRFQEAETAYRKSLELAPKNALMLNNLAWLLATCPDSKIRDAKQAVELAKQAVELAAKDGNSWNTLGAAHYAAGDWKAAVDALQKSKDLLGDTELSFNAFFLAMARWQLGGKDEARVWYDQAVRWMEKNKPQDEELLRFRAEAEELLGIEEKATLK